MADAMLPLLFSNVEDVEETGHALLALIISAVNDPHPQYSLSEIHHAMTTSGSPRFLVGSVERGTLPPSARPGSQDMLDVIGECCNAKENASVIQEAWGT
ncbi:hypothetical protein JAAARDRAFT_604472 [Jaapia argillacea MUCL 33604]|uniref:Uncharacterized protein n=1 Tax=Jaapia argillacea MUCL 33604 TaxID=933084 RepID=A0A067QA36_9AGAM|nr:hypothetical protein JAAARDRAFT_604472 [Jaapia argillacea MUCL 33604]